MKHVQRCHVLFYVIDYGVGVWRQQFDELRTELKLYDPELMKKKAAIIINKVDLMTNEVTIIFNHFYLLFKFDFRTKRTRSVKRLPNIRAYSLSQLRIQLDFCL